MGDLGSIPGSGISPEGGQGNHSRVLAWRSPWTEEPGSYSPWGHKESDTTGCAHMHSHVIVNLSKPIGCSTSRVNPGTSPVVQWRRRPASTAGATGSIPGRGTKILHSKWHGQKMFFEKESEHNRERGTWSDGHVLM